MIEHLWFKGGDSCQRGAGTRHRGCCTTAIFDTQLFDIGRQVRFPFHAPRFTRVCSKYCQANRGVGLISVFTGANCGAAGKCRGVADLH